MSSQPAVAQTLMSAAPGLIPARRCSSSPDLESIFVENHAMVFRTAYYVTGNTADAEDALQTVFLRLLKRDPRAELVENAGGYLHRSALNAARDVVRRRKPAHVALDEPEAASAKSAQPGPDSAHAAREIRDWLSRALSRLGARTAEMFVMRFFEGKDNSEIARLMDTTPATVAVSLCRARGRLHDEFRAWRPNAEAV